MSDVLIYDCVRTPRGRAKPSGGLFEMRPYRLVSNLLVALQLRNPKLSAAAVQDLLIGCVTAVADQAYNIAQAALHDANWPDEVAAVTVNRYCASGLETVHQAAARIAAGWDDLLVAGGLESMSRVPLGSGGGPILEDPELILAHALIPQGVAADLIATLHKFSREELDAYALQSQQRAKQAWQEKRFANSIVPITDANQLLLLAEDQHLRPSTTLKGLAELSPAFASTGKLGFDALGLSRYPQLDCIDHVHTAGNSSGLVDGAALTLLGSVAAGKAQGLQAKARIISIAVASSESTIMLLGFIPATEKALAKAGLKIKDIDLFEVNEAFAAIPIAFCAHFKVDQALVNVNGGAIAMGHPVGATGSMLLGTLIDELQRRKKKRGLVTLCAGGGQGIACIVEMI